MDDWHGMVSKTIKKFDGELEQELLLLLMKAKRRGDEEEVAKLRIELTEFWEEMGMDFAPNGNPT